MANTLSELEGSVLGVVAEVGECTAYRVRQIFRVSASAPWRASAGAVYPLLERLEGSGLIQSELREGDKRKSKILSISAQGRKVLQDWLSTLTPDLASPQPDPIRTRFCFLAQLAPAARREVVEQWLSATNRALVALSASKAEVDHFEGLAHRGAERELEARAAWLAEVLPDL